MTFYEFQVVYDSDGKVIFCQCTGNGDETNTRPLPVWLGNCSGKNVVSKWYSGDEYVSNGFWSFKAEELVGKFGLHTMNRVLITIRLWKSTQRLIVKNKYVNTYC